MLIKRLNEMHGATRKMLSKSFGYSPWWRWRMLPLGMMACGFVSGDTVESAVFLFPLGRLWILLVSPKIWYMCTWKNGVTFHVNVLIQTICFSLIWSPVGLLFGVVIEHKMLMKHTASIYGYLIAICSSANCRIILWIIPKILRMGKSEMIGNCNKCN